MTPRFVRPVLLALLLALGSLPVLASYRAPDETDPAKIVVYKTAKGEKYHADGCRFLSKEEDPKKKIKITLAEAKKLGLEPCKVCEPPPLP
jgi:hypothetical protein